MDKSARVPDLQRLHSLELLGYRQEVFLHGNFLSFFKCFSVGLNPLCHASLYVAHMCTNYVLRIDSTPQHPTAAMRNPLLEVLTDISLRNAD